ncbi:MAG: hypothetical protein M1825_001317 [Sarcosagium campestre]|nr:MAG: hypothetical protein M1825_001317 [Sarcosagium campestre]
MPLPALLRRNRKADGQIHRRHSSVIDPSHLASFADDRCIVDRASASSEMLAVQRQISVPFTERRSNLTDVTESSHDIRNGRTSNDVSGLSSSPPPNPKRFTLMKFRHASDSQLSFKAKKQAAQASEAPPVPFMPTAPSIITTAPTLDMGEKMQQKKKQKLLRMPGRLRLSSDRDRTSIENSSPVGSSISYRGLPSNTLSARDLNAQPSRVTFDEPKRPQIRSPGHDAMLPNRGDSNSSLPLPVSRLSESSRSEGSSGEPVADTSTSASNTGSTTSFFRLARRKKPPSLFPLPVRIAQPGSSTPTGGSPRASTSAAADSENQSTFMSSIRRDSAVASPVRSPSRLTLDGGSTPTAAQSMSMLRKDSTTSAHSARSSPSLAPPTRLGRKGRSSTKGSLDHVLVDQPLPTPPLPSGRTSTSTTGRSSLGGVFSFSRLRQSSEPPNGRFTSPGTPGSNGSKANSFNLAREAIVVPERENDDTPASYLTKLQQAVSRGVIAGVISMRDDTFSQSVLRSFMRSFAFFEDPMDMAIRKLLMEVELPKETQQIDRVLQQFADRYHECNPGIYVSSDSAYFIAFSLMLLQSDVFNKNNKRKMQRIDYVKNAKGEGVSEEVLECFYDNISYTPFIRVEDDIDLQGERKAAQKGPKPRFTRPIVDPLKKSSREPVDPYSLILDQKLDVLRPNLKDVLYVDDPYNYLGTATSLDMRHLQRTFFNSGILQIVSARSRPDAFKSPSTITNPEEAHPGVVDIKVTKVGVIWRKDAKKKKGRSPWQEWGALLTGAQLYFFRNVGWIKSLLHQYDSHHRQGQASGPVLFKPPLDSFKPDVLMSTDDAVALLDSSYKKHKNAFTFVRHGGYEETFLAENETEMNDWLAKLNYAAAFRSAGVRMRTVAAGTSDASPAKAVRRINTNSSNRSVHDTVGELPANAIKPDSQPQQISLARRQTMLHKIEDADQKLCAAQVQLESHLRTSRHLQILSPIQASTRAQIVLAAGKISAKVKRTRMEIWRLKCHKDILKLDLEDEERLVTEPAGKLPKSSQKAGSGQSGLDAQASQNSLLNRLDSKVSAVASHLSHPRSPRPPSNASSKDKFGADDMFVSDISKTNGIRNALTPWELPPLSFDPQSKSIVPGNGPGTSNDLDHAGLDHQSSVGSFHETVTVTRSHASESVKDETVKSSLEPGEAEVLKEAGLVARHPATPEPGHAGKQPDVEEHDGSPSATPADAEANERSKVRRSLHRTLREAHVPVHGRSKKGREGATSTHAPDEGSASNEPERLARSKGCFTVHGKKASVITLGSEWQNMTAEDRLKLRKSALSDETKFLAPSAVDDDAASRISARNNGAEETENLTGMSTPDGARTPLEVIDDEGDQPNRRGEDAANGDNAEDVVAPGKRDSTNDPRSHRKTMSHTSGTSTIASYSHPSNEHRPQPISA